MYDVESDEKEFKKKNTRARCTIKRRDERKIKERRNRNVTHFLDTQLRRERKKNTNETKSENAERTKKQKPKSFGFFFHYTRKKTNKQMNGM